MTLKVYDLYINFKAFKTQVTICLFLNSSSNSDIPVMLALKRFIRSLVLGFKSPKNRICSFFALLFLLIHEKYRVLCFETSKF